MAPLSFTRRQVLHNSLMGATALGLGGCICPTDPPTIEDLKLLIDPHTHVFNGADIPVNGFAREVLDMNGALRELFTAMARGATTAAHEIERLKDELADRPIAALAADTQSDRALLADYFQGILETNGVGRPPAFSEAENDNRVPDPAKAAARRQGLDQLAAMIAPVAAPAAPADFIADKRMVAEALADAVLQGEPAQLAALAPSFKAPDPCDGGENDFGNWWTAFRWATMLTRPRATIVRTLHSVFGAKAVPQFLAPALVDFGYWVNDFRTTPIAEQIEVNALLSRLANKNGYALHGYICYDPWRDLALRSKGQRSALELVKDAIGELGPDGSVSRQGSGFIGVKLYPPMGFRATGNAELSNDHFPDDLVTLTKKAPGAALDDVLAELYAWCAAQDVPILAHCSPSNFPKMTHLGPDGQPVGMATPNPAFWRPVLEKHASLRLNLGHAGGVTTQACVDHRHAGDWLDETYSLCQAYPNVYADISDLTELFDKDRQTDAEAIALRIHRALAKSPKAIDKILYGSDWSMQARLKGHERYLERMLAFFLGELAKIPDDENPPLKLPDDFRDRFFVRNAQRFLGLIANSNVLKRLAPFYGPWKSLPELKMSVISRFIAPV